MTEDPFLDKLSCEAVQIMGQKSCEEITQEILGKTMLMTPEEFVKLYHATYQRLGPTVYGASWERMSQTWEEMDSKVKQLNIAVAEDFLSKYAVIPRLPLAESVPLPFDPDDYPVI